MRLISLQELKKEQKHASPKIMTAFNSDVIAIQSVLRDAMRADNCGIL